MDSQFKLQGGNEQFLKAVIKEAVAVLHAQQVASKETSKTGVWGYEPLIAAMMYAGQTQDQKQVLEQFCNLISWVYPDLAGKTTAVMFQMNNYYLLDLLVNRQSLRPMIEKTAAKIQSSRSSSKDVERRQSLAHS